MNVHLKQVSGRSQSASVVLASARPALHERLKEAFADSRFRLIGVEGGLTQLRSQIGAGVRPGILIADLQGDLDKAILAIEDLRGSGYSGAIITMSETLDEASVRGLLRLQITDWLPADAEVDAIVQACERASSARRHIERESQATCICFLPAAGGVGTTTLAIQTAFLLAQRSQSFSEMCLIDLNFHTGTLVDYLDLQPVLDVDAIAKQPDRLDARLLEVMIARHPTGMAVVAAPRAPTEHLRVNGAVISNILGVVSDNFDHMVLDLPPVWQPWTFDVLQDCDQILVVTEFTVPAMRKARELVNALEERFKGGPPEVRIVVNKFRQRLFGAGLRKSDAAALLGEPLAAFIPEERDLISEAINRGELIDVTSSSNRVSRELARLVFKE
jgi:pilus assembly protein CpaE